jgi:uncharacterized protein YjiS (DUF1127 family)
MWASNDPNSRLANTALNIATTEVDHVSITKAARRMQAEEFAKLILAVGRGIKSAAATLAAPYKVWREYQDTYAELTQLDDRMLSDIGIARSDIPRVAAGLWAPQARMERVVKIGLGTPKAEANVNRPQVAA